jgi:D-alanine-D-alanine ligase
MSERGRVRLVVLFGGRSAEHEVSCVSAISVLGALDPGRYDVLPVGITREGSWVLSEDAQRLLQRGVGVPGLPATLEARGPELEPLRTLERRSAEDLPVVVLPLLHGPFGEDGTVQGLCELAGVPYVGAGVLGSAVAMDKIVAKRLLTDAGLPVARWLGFRERDVRADLSDTIDEALGWPVFVKPANLGSSVGVARVDDAAALKAAVDNALSYDEWLVVEEAVWGRELECGVLGNEKPEASVVGEIRPSHDFYDYEDKYVDGAAELVAPADVPAAVSADVQRLAVAAFEAVRSEGMARVDFFYEEAGRGLLVNEVNTIPGFTPISMFPRLWDLSGVPYPKLVDRLVELAIERHTRRSSKVGRGRV